MLRRGSAALVAVLLLGVTTVPLNASAATKGASVLGTMSGSGASTLDSAGGHPILRSDSDGTLDATVLGPSTYHLTVSYTGTRRLVGLTITAQSGTLRLSAGPMITSGLFESPLLVTGGTGAFARATGSFALGDYTKTDVECVPSPPSPIPNLFCTWNETATISGTIRVQYQAPPRWRTRA